MEHAITRQRHETKRRRLTVASVEPVTPAMLRIRLTGDELAGFVSGAPDDHVKLFIGGEAGKVEMRDYTPRHFDPETLTLTLDFAVHEAGPATRWAIEAKPGDMLEIGGPRGSLIVPQTFDWWLLVGDETALPAIGRRIEEMREGVRVISLVAVTGPEEEQVFATKARHEAIWLHRPLEAADDPAPLLAALEAIELPKGDGYVWIAAEARVARAVRDHLHGTRGHPLGWMRAAGYWLKGVADAHEKLDD